MMPTDRPYFAAAGSQGDSGFGSIPLKSAALSTTTGALLGPLSNLLQIAGNNVLPIEYPSIGEQITAYWRGWLDNPTLKAWLRHRGVDWQADGGNSQLQQAWYRVISAGQPQLSPEQTAYYVHCGKMTRNQLYHAICYAGLGVYDVNHNHVNIPAMQQLADKYMDTVACISPELAIRLRRLEKITLEYRNRILDGAGFKSEERRNVLLSDEAVPSNAELWSWVRRGLISQADAVTWMEAEKWLDKDVRDFQNADGLVQPNLRSILELYRRGLIGPIDPAKAALMEEYPSEWDTWFDCTGNRPTLDASMPHAGGSKSWTNAQIEWANHWRVNDPSSVAKWRDYVRAQQLGWIPPVGFQPAPIIPQDVWRATQAEGVRPEYRGSATIDTYQQIGLRHLTIVAELLGFTDQQLKQRFTLDGYADSDVDTLTKAFRRKIELYWSPYLKSVPEAAKLWAVNDVKTQYLVGLADVATTQNRLYFHGFTIEQTADILTNWQVELAHGNLNKSREEIQVIATAHIAGYVRSSIELFQYGQLSLPALSALLQTYGLTPAQVNDVAQGVAAENQATVARDNYQQTLGFHKQAVSEQVNLIKEQYYNGLTSDTQAFGYLVSAGVSSGDATAILGTISGRIHLEECIAITKLVRREWSVGALTTTQAGASLVTAGISPQKVAGILSLWQAELPPNHHAETAQEILGWVAKGLMTPKDAQVRLTNLGWSGLDESLALAQAESVLAGSKAKAATAANSKQAKAVSAIATQQKALLAQVKKNQVQVAKWIPEATLKKLLAAGDATPLFAAQWFEAVGYQPDDALKILTLWGYGPQTAGYIKNGTYSVPVTDPGLTGGPAAAGTKLDTAAAAIDAGGPAAAGATIGQ
jgi:hypothetical protein